MTETEFDDVVYEETYEAAADGTLGGKRMVTKGNGIHKIIRIPTDPVTGIVMNNKVVRCAICNMFMTRESAIREAPRYICINCYLKGHPHLTKDQYLVFRVLTSGLSNKKEIAEITGLTREQVTACKEFLVNSGLVIKGHGPFAKYRISSTGKDVLNAYDVIYGWDI